MWTFLLVGSLGAVGAALAVGTLGALVRFRRTGTFPGREGEQVTPSTRAVVGLWARVVVGTAIAGYAVVTLSDRGLL